MSREDRVDIFVRGIERKSLISFAISGAALAAGLYTYIPFRVIPIVIARPTARTVTRSTREQTPGSAGGIATDRTTHTTIG